MRLAGCGRHGVWTDENGRNHQNFVASCPECNIRNAHTPARPALTPAQKLALELDHKTNAEQLLDRAT